MEDQNPNLNPNKNETPGGCLAIIIMGLSIAVVAWCITLLF